MATESSPAPTRFKKECDFPRCKCIWLLHLKGNFLNVCNCSGWWDQNGLGRQPMHDLVLTINDGKISGSGTDIVADFTVSGVVREDGKVEILKQYQGRHAVLYVGNYDGEGAYYGEWDIDGFRGTWFIRLLSDHENSGHIEEIG